MKIYDHNEYIVLYDEEEQYKLELSTIKETMDYLGRSYKSVITAYKNHSKIKSYIDGKVYYIHKQKLCTVKKRKNVNHSKIRFLDNQNRITLGKPCRNKLGNKLQVDYYNDKIIVTKAKEEE